MYSVLAENFWALQCWFEDHLQSPCSLKESAYQEKGFQSQVVSHCVSPLLLFSPGATFVQDLPEGSAGIGSR